MNDYNLLRTIKRRHGINYDYASNQVQDALVRLSQSGHLTVHFVETGDKASSIYKITSLGENYIFEKRIENRHWFIPVVISVIALIKSFLPEILLLLELLRKQLMQ